MTARLRSTGDVWVKVRRLDDGRWSWLVLRQLWLFGPWVERRGVEVTAGRALRVGLRQRRVCLAARDLGRGILPTSGPAT